MRKGLSMIIVESKRIKTATILKKYPDAILIDVTSKATDEWVKLSPFYPHGGIPVPFSDGLTASCVEAIWQGLKVFEHCDVDTTLFDNTTMQGLKRTVRQFGKPLGHRKGVHGTELFCYIDARKHIYIPTYKWVLENRVQDLIIQLRELSESKTIVLLDYNTNANVDDPSKPLSHASLVKAYIESVRYQVVSKLYNGDVIIKKKQEHANIYDYAIVDQNNKVIVPFKYHCIEEFQDGLYKVSFDGKYGLLDKNYNEIISPTFNIISLFENSILVARKDYYKTTYGLMSTVGRPILPCIYASIRSATLGLLWIENEKRQTGLATTDGRILIEPKYGKVESFIGSFAKVNSGSWHYDEDDRDWNYYEGKWGVIGIDGNEALSPIYESIEYDPNNKWFHVSKQISFCIFVSNVFNKSGNQIIKQSKDKNWEYYENKWGIKFSDGYQVPDPIYESIEYDAKNNRINPSKQIFFLHKIVSGIMNESGNQIIKNSKGEHVLASDQYDWQEDFDENLQSIVYRKDEMGYVNEDYQLIIHANTEGKDKTILLPKEFDWGYDSPHNYIVVKKGDNKGVINSEGSTIIDCLYESIRVLSENDKVLFLCGKHYQETPDYSGHGWTVIDANGRTLFSSVFDKVKALGHELIALKNKNGKYTIGDFTGHIKADTLFDDVKEFGWQFEYSYEKEKSHKEKNLRYAIVRKGEEYGAINSYGQIVLQPMYRSLLVDQGNTFIADRTLINLSGERIAARGDISIPVSPKYQYAEIINNGLILVKKEGLYGCINQIGTTLIPIIYLSLTCYENLAVVELYDESNGTTKRGVVNYLNEQIVPLNDQYSEIIIKDNLILYRQNGCWGAYTLQGRLICNPSYNHIETLTNSLIKVGKDSVEYEDFRYNDWVDGELVELIGSQECNVIYWGTIDINGKCILPLDYHYIENNNDGLIMIKHLEGKYGLLDMMGNTVLEPTYKSIGSFIDGLAIVSKPYTYYDNKDERYRTGSIYGVIDYSFKEVIPCDYKKIEYKRELGLFLTDVGYLSLDGRYIAELDGKHICINKEFLYCKPFNNGYAIAVKKTGEKAKYALINSKSENILPTIYDQIIRLQNGLYILKIDDKWGLADTDGCIILPASYEYMGKVINNYVVIMKNEQWGLLSIETKAIIINTNASYLGPCMDGLCRINVGGNYSQSTKKVDGGRWGFVNPFGQIIIEPQYDLAYGFSEGFAAVKSCGKWGFINKEGINIVPCIYEYFEASYYNGRAHLSNDGTEFTFDNQGNIIESHEIRDYNNNYYYDDD